MSCNFCNNSTVSKEFAPVVYLRHYKNTLQKLADYAYRGVTDFKVRLGNEIGLRIEICNDCYIKYKKIPLFDFKTEKNGERKARELVQLYTERGFKIDSIHLNGFLVNEWKKHSFDNEYIFKTTHELFERDKIYVELAALIFSMRDFDEKDALLTISEVFFKTNLQVPEHELFIYFSYFIEKLKSSDGLFEVCHKLLSRENDESDGFKTFYIQELASKLIWLDDPDKVLAKEMFDSLETLTPFE